MIFIVYFLFVDFSINVSSSDYGWNSSKVIFIAMKLFIITLTILIPVIIIKNRQSVYYNELSTRNEQFLEAELVASNAYRQSQEDTRAFQHDMNNNLLVVSAMMQKQQFGEAEAYINELCGKLSSFSLRIVTGDDMLDALLSTKLLVMEERSINFSIRGLIYDSVACINQNLHLQLTRIRFFQILSQHFRDILVMM